MIYQLGITGSQGSNILKQSLFRAYQGGGVPSIFLSIVSKKTAVYVPERRIYA
jgi:hypothetical protein